MDLQAVATDELIGSGGLWRKDFIGLVQRRQIGNWIVHGSHRIDFRSWAADCTANSILGPCKIGRQCA